MGERLKRWSKDELARLEAISSLYSLSELSEFFGRTESAVSTKLKRLNLKHRESRNVYSNEETEDTKECMICKEILPLSEFYPTKYGRKGVYHQCRPCYNTYRKLKRLDRAASANELSKEEKEKLVEEFKQKHKNATFYCNPCDSEKTIEDYYLSIKRSKTGKYRVAKDCKCCRVRRKLTRAQKRGYS